MTPENIIAIVAIAGTIVGILAGGIIGYMLSIREKREEWRKEYRAKRLSPLVDYINAVMGDVFEHQLRAVDIDNLKNIIDKSTNDQMRSVADEMLKEAAGKQTQLSTQILELHKSEAWRACIAASIQDTQLEVLITKFEISLGNFSFQRTDKNQEELVTLGKQILARADEVVIKGSKMPRIERFKEKGEK